MKFALTDANAKATDVVHINAHATSTPVGDIAEYKAMRSALGGALDNVVVTATKSMTGHLLGGAGAVESVFTILGLKEGLIPPTLNLDNQDGEIKVNVAKNKPFKLSSGANFALNNSFGFGGHNVCIAFSKN
jgi:3-oxoacyl-[acyl-carrier-protein] synthase II